MAERIERFLTVDEVADALRLKAATVRSWLKSGRLRGKRLGRKFLIPETEVLDLIDNTANADAKASDHHGP